MAIVVVIETPGMNQAMYEQGTDRLTGGRGVVKKASDWPVPGLISHTAAPTPDGWLVVDVWESEDAFRKFGEHLRPMLREIGAPDVEPKIYPAYNVVTS
ncbi:hypothetical protein ACGF07_20350 [Kitasatospora sp. NPDC048194]|uniref:hypothetical protein n=1 Tax=Kitasatospora sp. NPDC048194 TaxID=3364045 RepID=UPI00371F787A